MTPALMLVEGTTEHDRGIDDPETSCAADTELRINGQVSM
jgi:hypothetical protein